MTLNRAADQHSFTQAKFFNHRARYERIGALAGEIRGRVAEKAVSIGVHLEDARSSDEGQRFPVVGDFRLMSIGHGRSAAGASSSAAAAATLAATAVAAAISAAAAPTVAASTPASTLATAVTASSASTSAATTTTLLLGHVHPILREN
jgi:hypothetical protein